MQDHTHEMDLMTRNATDLSGPAFDRIADTFRDPRVWWMERGTWQRQKL